MKLKILLPLLLAAAVPVMAKTFFEDVSEAVGLTGAGTSTGAVWLDFDRDGWPDLFVQGQLWRNLEGKKFVNVTAAAVFDGKARTAVAADFNGDGFVDLVFPDREGALWLGDGRGHFRRGEMAPTPNPMSQAAAAADLDGDGWLDLYVSSYETLKPEKSFPDFRYRNQHGKLELVWTAPKEETMRARCVTMADFNDDGAIDIYVGNYRLQPNFLWINDGKGNFVNRGREFGAAGTEREKVTFKTELGVEYRSSGHTISALWGDFDNDGLFDLFVGNFSHPPNYQDRAQFLQNGGPDQKYHFIDRSADAALVWQESYSGSAAADFDNDGRLDLFFATVYPNDRGKLFRNLGDWRFRKIPKAGGIASALTYQAAWADFDRDGRLDLFTAGKLYRNVSAAGHFLRLELVDHAPNTTAVGAVIKLSGENVLPQIRQVEAGSGHGCQNEAVCHFGLGDHTGTFTAVVRWPDRTVENFAGLQSDGDYRLVRGQAPASRAPVAAPQPK